MYAGILGSDNFNGNDSDIICRFVAPLSMYSNQPGSPSDTLTLRRVGNDLRAQRWEIVTKIAPEYKSKFLVAGCVAGYSRNLIVRPPQVDRLPGEAAFIGADTAQFPPYTAGQRTIFHGGNQNAYKEGDFVAFADTSGLPYKKIHMVVTVSASSFTFWPGLRRTLTGTITIYSGKRVKGYFTIDPDTRLGITYVDGLLADPGSITLIEDIG